MLLLSTTAINALFIAAIGFFQIAKNKREILWFYAPPTDTFLSTFPYHWQGAAYLVIVLATTVGLAAHHYAQARRTFKRSNPSGLFVFVGLVLTLMILFSFSKVSAIIASGLAVAFLTHIGYRELSIDALPSRKLFLAAIALVCTGVGAHLGGTVAENYIDRGDRSYELQPGVANAGTWSASWEAGAAMFRQQPLFGWGAGSLLNAFPEVVKREEIEGADSSLVTEYAASDWIRLPAEFGIVGILLLLLLIGSLARHYFNRKTLENPLVGFLLIGTCCGLLLGIGSLVFTNVAFLTTWSLFFTLGIILIRIERALRSRGDEASS
jgi:O-antigen ligase